MKLRCPWYDGLRTVIDRFRHSHFYTCPLCKGKGAVTMGQQVRPKELQVLFENYDGLGATAMIEHNGTRGIAIEIGEVLSATWRQGKIIVFWEDGDHTILPEGPFVLLEFDLFGRRK